VYFFISSSEFTELGDSDRLFLFKIASIENLLLLFCGGDDVVDDNGDVDVVCVEFVGAYGNDGKLR
jgi:hypothetical protein